MSHSNCRQKDGKFNLTEFLSSLIAKHEKQPLTFLDSELSSFLSNDGAIWKNFETLNFDTESDIGVKLFESIVTSFNSRRGRGKIFTKKFKATFLKEAAKTTHVFGREAVQQFLLCDSDSPLFVSMTETGNQNPFLSQELQKLLFPF